VRANENDLAISLIRLVAPHIHHHERSEASLGMGYFQKLVSEPAPKAADK
jgi:hypothetical protein